MKSEQINELAAALSKAQGEIENAVMDKINPHFKSKYASLASVRDAIQGPLSKHGLAYTQATEIREGGLVLVTTLWHSSGQWVSSEYPLPSSGRPQELGSAITYARRYSLSAIIGNSADEDDDAEGAETAKQHIAANGKARPISERAMPKVAPVPEQDSKARFIKESEGKIAKFGDEKLLLAWWNSDDQKKARRDFDLTDADVEALKVVVIARKDAIRKSLEDTPLTAAG